MTVTMQLLSGGLILAVCSLVHLGILTGAVRLLRFLGEDSGKPYGLRAVMFMGTGLAAAVAAHIVQIWIWAAMFVVTETLPEFSEAVYFSLATYTTLGYGDVVVGQADPYLCRHGGRHRTPQLRAQHGVSCWHLRQIDAGRKLARNSRGQGVAGLEESTHDAFYRRRGTDRDPGRLRVGRRSPRGRRGRLPALQLRRRGRRASGLRRGHRRGPVQAAGGPVQVRAPGVGKAHPRHSAGA